MSKDFARIIRSFLLFASAVLGLTACDQRGPQSFQPTSVSEDRLVSSLTDDETTRLCNEYVAYLDRAHPLRPLVPSSCRLSAIVTTSDETSCERTSSDCLLRFAGQDSWPGCVFSIGSRAACPVTVREYVDCVGEMLDLLPESRDALTCSLASNPNKSDEIPRRIGLSAHCRDVNMRCTITR